ncbi:tetratricopeptide repeat protein [Sphingobacterium sp.]|uniref:tetratricopeptide repeat protein n=1 Tax=Sphingobacterium sp. TaxID=341027 RepID=UPI00258ABCD3|nr:tetratricopeptide repeat protein [Sphingobacterium sp.]WET68251.1 MAG: tetratricopeptide repeat protein [Sphingobacterium sp.]
MRISDKIILFLLFFIQLFLWHPGTAQVESFKDIRGLSQNHPDSAIMLVKKRYAKAVTDKDLLLQANCLQAIGWLCVNQGHYGQAQDYYFQADRLYTQLNSKQHLASNWSDIGELNIFNKQHDVAKVYFNKALHSFRTEGDKNGEAGTLGNIGHLFEKEANYDSAFVYQNLALSIYSSVGNKNGEAKIHENLGSIYEDLARYDSAFLHFEKASKLYTETKDNYGKIVVINNMGDIFRKTNKYPESIKLTQLAYQMAENLGDVYQMAATTKDLSRTYALRGQMDSAYFYAEKSRKLVLELYSVDGARHTAFFQALYDMNQKAEEIEKLQVTKRINLIMLWGTIVVLILLIVLSYVLYSRQKIKIKNQIAESRKQEAERELTEIALKNQLLEDKQLKQELSIKQKELTSHTLNLIRNNQFLEELRDELKGMVKDERRDQKRQMQKLVLQINENITQGIHWKEFMGTFEKVHHSFFEKLIQRFPDLTAADMRLIALLKINLNNIEIAVLLGISQDSLRVARHRLRKKLRLEQGDDLAGYLVGIS